MALSGTYLGIPREKLANPPSVTSDLFVGFYRGYKHAAFEIVSDAMTKYLRISTSQPFRKKAYDAQLKLGEITRTKLGCAGSIAGHFAAHATLVVAYTGAVVAVSTATAMHMLRK